jgi:hypothetical protein
MLALITSPTFAAYIVRDSFTVGDGTGTAGANLNGVAAESAVGGAATWVAHPNLQFQSGNYVQRVNVESDAVAAIALTPTATAPEYTVSARLRPIHDPPNIGASIALGFTDNTDLQPFWSPGGSELWIYISDTGGYEVYADDVTTSLSGPPGAEPAPLFFPGEFNEVKLVYNTTANQLTAYINGVTVVNAANLGAFVPNIGAAGIFSYASAGQADDFVAIVPEPVGVGMLGILSVIVLLRAHPRPAGGR